MNYKLLLVFGLYYIQLYTSSSLKVESYQLYHTNVARRYRKSVSRRNEAILVNISDAMRNENFRNTDERENITQDYHMYYNSTVYKKGFFIDLEDDRDKIPDAEVYTEETLSNSYLKAVQVHLDFVFPFYGNPVKWVYVTTGGFISVGQYFHSHAHIVHYIAPMMAHFNTSLSNSSKILIAKAPDYFIVQWKNVTVPGVASSKKWQEFDFEVILHKNGSIVLAYKTLPLKFDYVFNKQHNVSIGIADGFIKTYLVRYGFTLMYFNYIYRYHKVDFPIDKIKAATTIELDLLPNCAQLKNCSDCLDKRQSGKFVCRWCEKLKHCSDTFDWNRQKWMSNGCDKESYAEKEQCSTPLEKKSSSEKNSSPEKKSSPKVGEKNHKSNKTMIGAVIGVIIVLLLVVGAAFFYYAYTHPQSATGMWLIEHRPSRIMKASFSQVQEDELL